MLELVAQRIMQITAVALVCLVIGPSCSGARPPSLDERITATVKADAARERRAGNVEQARILADGVVTQREYDASWGRYRRCLERLGMKVGEPKLNPIDRRRYLLEIDPAQKVDSDRFAACQDRDVGAVEAAFTQRPRPMEATLRRSVRACLRRKGYVVPREAADIRDFTRVVGLDHVEDLGGCFDVIPKLYPGLPYWGWGPPSDL